MKYTLITNYAQSILIIQQSSNDCYQVMINNIITNLLENTNSTVTEVSENHK